MTKFQSKLSKLTACDCFHMIVQKLKFSGPLVFGHYLEYGTVKTVKAPEARTSGKCRCMVPTSEILRKRGQLKGIKQILMERKLWRPELKLECKTGCPNEEEEGFGNCCA